jgi:hypothetical protein
MQGNGDMGEGRGSWAHGRDSPCSSVLLLLPCLEQSLHHNVGTVLLVQGPEVLSLQGTPVAQDSQPEQGGGVVSGAEFSSLDLGPVSSGPRGLLWLQHPREMSRSFSQ